MRKLVLAVILFFLCGLSSSLNASASEKFGYLSYRLVISKYKKAEELYNVLDKKKADYESDLEKKAKEIRLMTGKYDLLSDGQKKKKAPEINQKIRDFKIYELNGAQDLRREKEEKDIEILTDIETAAKEYAKKEGYDLIFGKELLIYATETYDLSDQIINIVNKNYKAKK